MKSKVIRSIVRRIVLAKIPIEDILEDYEVYGVEREKYADKIKKDSEKSKKEAEKSRQAKLKRRQKELEKANKTSNKKAKKSEVDKVEEIQPASNQPSEPQVELDKESETQEPNKSE